MIKDQVLYLKNNHSPLVVRVEMKKNRIYKLELSILLKRCLKCVDNEGGMGFIWNGVVENENHVSVVDELVVDHEEYVIVDASDVQNSGQDCW